ncbi:MAG: aminoglycoside 6-adenylyltransferase [Oscillospiraceae bacterium]|jgi:aminoglycoside 6-adenylyltransferase|nr:aminoglycoside 6-adenylyltransferase [Oscillospiraceae bacterium]
MKTETEVINLILNFARSNENIRAVLLEGSRANPNGKVDELSDYDIAFVTTSNEQFLDKRWFNSFALKFGKVAILQEPDNSDLFENTHDPRDHYSYLMLFDSGLRLDITFETVDFINKITLGIGSAIIVLLDKGNIFPNFMPNDKEFWIVKPTENQFKACCNEFWWCLQNIAKGMVRDELSYAMKMYEICHDELDKMAEWYIGTQNNFSISAGKFGKYFKKYLPKNLYEIYESTYSNGDYENLWNAVFAMCDLFRILAKEVAEKLVFEYTKHEDDGMMKYLKKLRNQKLWGMPQNS